MRQVFKFELTSFGKAFTFSIIEGRFCSRDKVDFVGLQDGKIMLWTTCDDNVRETTRKFVIRGTGQEISVTGYQGPFVHYLHRGTVFDGPYVWHVFEVIDERGEQ